MLDKEALLDYLFQKWGSHHKESLTDENHAKIFWDLRDVFDEIKSGRFDIEGWRPLPTERKPDFGRLKEGDCLIVEYKCGLITFVFFDKIENDEYPFCVFFYAESSSRRVVRAKNKFEEIEKITRINLETKEFEDI